MDSYISRSGLKTKSLDMATRIFGAVDKKTVHPGESVRHNRVNYFPE